MSSSHAGSRTPSPTPSEQDNDLDSTVRERQSEEGRPARPPAQRSSPPLSNRLRSNNGEAGRNMVHQANSEEISSRALAWSERCQTVLEEYSTHIKRWKHLVNRVISYPVQRGRGEKMINHRREAETQLENMIQQIKQVIREMGNITNSLNLEDESRIRHNRSLLDQRIQTLEDLQRSNQAQIAKLIADDAQTEEVESVIPFIRTTPEMDDVTNTETSRPEQTVEYRPQYNHPPQMRENFSYHETVDPYPYGHQYGRERRFRPSVKPIEIPKFDGNMREWRNFWNLFKILIHDSELPTIEKFNYLRQSLTGDAATQLLLFPTEETSYIVAINHLLEMYDQQGKIQKHLLKELIQTHAPSNTEKDILHMMDKIAVIFHQAKAAGEPDSTLALVLVESKIPTYILHEVNKHFTENKNPTAIKFTDTVRNYLRQRSQNSIFGMDQNRQQSKRTSPTERHEKPTAKKFPATVTSTASCFLCKGSHAPWNCTATLTRKEKLNILTKEKRCGLCLKKNHLSNECKSNRKCSKCEGKHHEVICFGKNTNRKVNLVNMEEIEENEGIEQEYTIQFSATETETNQYDSALLPVGNIKIRHNGRTTEIPAVLDCGSDTSFIDETLASQLGLKVIISKKIRLKTFGATSELTKMKQVETKFDSIDASPISAKLWTKKVLTGPLQTIKFTHPDLTGVHNSSSTSHVTPKILIGSDLMWTNLIEIKQLNEDYTLVKTKLGNFITGKASPKNSRNAFSVITGDTTMKIPLWNKLFVEEQEEFSGTEKAEKEQRDRTIQENFLATVKKRQDGYHVAFPWKDNLHELPDNKALAQRRFTSLVLSLTKNPEFLKQYHTIITDQLEQGIIERASEPYPTARVIHYIAHQAVATPLKETTKLRIVYDASGHYQNKPSLNDTIHQGPLLLPSLIGMNLRFRCGKYAVIADVQKAFLQVRLLESERDATRFFWLRDISKPITPDNVEIYRFTRVPFGINASPFLLGATMQYHLEGYGTENRLAVLLKENLYVDNILLSTNDPQQLLQWLPESKAIFSGMKMNLREFISNSTDFNEALTQTETNASKSPKVLGITWNTVTDQWQCKVTVPTTALTKRGISQAVASIYDPMGWICPALLPLRKFLQSLWNDLLDWDTPLPLKQQNEWKSLTESFGTFSKNLNRALPESASNEHIMITCTDSSGSAIGIATYVTPEDLSSASIVFAKSKLHSKSSNVTIPKAEMSALAKGVTTTLSTLREMKSDISIKKVIFLSDSEIALAWIKQKPDQKTTGVFVQNRIKEILKNAELIEHNGATVQFGYINTKDNPADIATRGCSSLELSGHFWWNPHKQLARAMENELFSIEYPPMFNVNLVTSKDDFQEDWLNNCNTWDMAVEKWISENYPATEPLTAKLYQEAEEALLYLHQTSLLSRLSAAQRQDLRPLLRGNLWVCRGRMSNADLEEEAKFPILVLPKTLTAKLLIQKAHSTYHKSISHTMADVRQRFWIPQLRSQTTSVIRKCVECQRFNNRPYTYPPSGDIPSRRLTQCTPFQHVGVDYFGPLNTQEGSTWGCIYTCTVTRLIHIETITDLTATSFINCLRKIWGRRGVPESITSDNASTFELGRKIADKIISLQQDHRLQNVMALQKITWHNITPYAPWQGGFYERLIRSVKTAMYKNLKHLPTREELAIVLIECEAVVNSRPLTYVGTENDADTILRPIDFLHKEITLNVTIEDKEDDEEYCHHPALRTQLDAEQALQSSYKKTAKFWETWRELYVKELRASHKHTISIKKAGSLTQPTIGQVVLIHDNMQPRHKWNIGRILSTTTSKDGSIREVSLRSETGRIQSRPINLLYPLEIPEEELPPTLQLSHNNNEEIPADYPSTNTRRQPRRWYGSTDSLIYVMCLILLAIPSVSAQSLPSIQCSPTGVITSGSNITDQQLCLAQNCITLFSTGPIHLNAADIITDYAVTWTFLLHGNIHHLQQNCHAGSFCKTVTCTFCMETMLNPSCWPWTSIILITLCVYAITATCYGILYTPWIIGKPIRLWFYAVFTCVRYIFKTISKWFKHFTTPTKIKRSRGSVIPLITLSLIVTGQCCQEINFLHSDSAQCSNDQCHMNTHIQTVISPYTQETCLQLSHKENKIAFLRIQWLETRFTCNAKTLYWTRATEPHVWDSKRCPHTGSCTNNKCLDIMKNSIIPELQPANQLPGTTHCVESCGGPGCGCFYPSSGCLFYRTYLKPNSDTVYQVVECDVWTPSTKIQLTHTTGVHTKVYNMTLLGDTPVTRDLFTLQVTGLSTPIIPLMQQRFILSSTETAIMPKHSQLQCPDQLTAATMTNCTADPICTCSPAEDAIRCDCKEDSITSAFRNIHQRLPLISPTYSLVSLRDRIIMQIKRNTMAEMLLTIKGTFNTSSTFTNASCTIPDATVTGCYNCQQGAQTSLSCTSPQPTMAATQCGETAFMLQCNPDGNSNTIRLSASSATPYYNCSYTCGDEIKQFSLTGVLYYVNNIYTLQQHYTEANHSNFQEATIAFPWPDISHFFDLYNDWMKEIMICASITLIILITTYITVTRYSMTMIFTLLKILRATACLPVFFVFSLIRLLCQTRKTHIYILITIVFTATNMNTSVRALQESCARAGENIEALRHLNRRLRDDQGRTAINRTLKAVMSLETAKRREHPPAIQLAAIELLSAYREVRNFLHSARSTRVFEEDLLLFDVFGSAAELNALAASVKETHLANVPVPMSFQDIRSPAARLELPPKKEKKPRSLPKASDEKTMEKLNSIEGYLKQIVDLLKEQKKPQLLSPKLLSTPRKHNRSARSSSSSRSPSSRSERSSTSSSSNSPSPSPERKKTKLTHPQDESVISLS